MKNITAFILMFSISLMFTSNLQAQNKKSVPKSDAAEHAATHRIVFQLVSGDTTVHKNLMKQLNNVLTVAPETQIEVVCQGGGLDMITKDKSIVEEKIKILTQSHVVFNACEFAMKERKLEKDQLIPEAGTVPAGIIEIVTKQEQGWSYIRSGN